jgi:hypothetical protein
MHVSLDKFHIRSHTKYVEIRDAPIMLLLRRTAQACIDEGFVGPAALPGYSTLRLNNLPAVAHELLF